MKRYTLASNWQVTHRFVLRDDRVMELQSADIETPDGFYHYGGAYRITLDGKPYKKGKGGTVPWWGETAWSLSMGAFNDLTWADRYGNS